MSVSPEPGFECEFTEQLPTFVRSLCPICLLVLREPYQVTCCGKSFCRSCIRRVRETSMLCPACKQEDFRIYPDKGLKQELYGLRVFCSNKDEGCDWQGELGCMSQHLNADPDLDGLLEGCAFTRVSCLFCSELHCRLDIEQHQNSECAERPFTCSLCGDYASTYADIIANHSPVCKCRPVECPNSCGINNLQHQHLEEHVSTQCPLSYMECEFAGCGAKVYRKDLPSHLGENLISHMSLLAKENMKLKEQLQKQTECLTAMVKTKTDKVKRRFRALLKEQANQIQSVQTELKKQTKVSTAGKRLVKRHRVRERSI